LHFTTSAFALEEVGFSLLRCYLPLNVRNRLYIRKACKRFAIANDFNYSLAVLVDQVCNIKREFLAVCLKWLSPCAGIGWCVRRLPNVYAKGVGGHGLAFRLSQHLLYINGCAVADLSTAFCGYLYNLLMKGKTDFT
jgi:hypothetical protein